jgi:YD repeat-containing protein
LCASVTDVNGAYTMSYDTLNRATVTMEPFGQTLTATYDAASNRTQLQDSQGGLITSAGNRCQFILPSSGRYNELL